MISSNMFAHDYDKQLLEGAVDQMNHLDDAGKALLGEAFLKGMLFGIYHAEGTNGKQE